VPAHDARDRDEAPAGEERKPFLLRVPPSLLAELRAWAGDELRSLNGHIEFLLREAVRKRRGDRAASRASRGKEGG
jgi:hypothetical protein